MSMQSILKRPMWRAIKLGACCLAMGMSASALMAAGNAAAPATTALSPAAQAMKQRIGADEFGQAGGAADEGRLGASSRGASGRSRHDRQDVTGYPYNEYL